MTMFTGNSCWTLQNMGFDTVWIGWIQRCISTSSFSVLIIGETKGFFKRQRVQIGSPYFLLLLHFNDGSVQHVVVQS